MRREKTPREPRTRRRKRGSRGENTRTSFLRSEGVVVPSFPERAARRENMSVSFANRRMLSLRQNKRSSFPGHAPGKDTLRAANAATKEGFTGRKRVKRKRLPVVFPSFSERGQTGENARANAVSGRALSPVKIKIRLFPDIRREKTP